MAQPTPKYLRDVSNMSSLSGGKRLLPDWEYGSPPKPKQRKCSSDPVPTQIHVPQGGKVFYQHHALSWREGIAAAVDGEHIIVQDGEESHRVHYTQVHLHCIPDWSPSDLRQAWRHLRDLLELTDLHEAPLLTAIQYRFADDLCYVHMGQMVLAVNPFKPISAYDDGHMDRYIRQVEGLLPHVWSVAHQAYHNMLATKQDQSILISGESGAGKTESTKSVIKYLGQLSCHHCSSDAFMCDRVALLSHKLNEGNPLLEAFGNAHTIRNENSSRFGKFTMVAFDHSGMLIGATIQNYLLERSRVVHHSEGERGFHIFYQMLAGFTEAEKAEYHLGNIADYHCLTQGGAHGTECQDQQNYQQLLQAMAVVGITDSERKSIWRLLAAILHLLNMKLVNDEHDAVHIVNLEVAHIAASLLQIPPTTLIECLTTARTEVRGELFIKRLEADKASAIRDTLCKALYSWIFSWLIDKLNAVLKPSNVTEMRSIGILDIFGFEDFETNSLEQLLINYANESLQQHYNEFVFNDVHAEYVKEGIVATVVQHKDNKACVDFIQSSTGVLGLLDDECRFPRGCDSTFTFKLLQHGRNFPCFKAPRMAQPTFEIEHYAGAVEYTTTNFLEKNKDVLGEAVLQTFQSSADPFLAHLVAMAVQCTAKTFEVEPYQGEALHCLSSPTLSSRTAVRTVAGQFKQQLQQLLQIIRSTNPYWVRCIKPNMEQVADQFDAYYVLGQLQSCGVLQTIRMLAEGYPIRLDHQHFAQNYKALLRSFDIVSYETRAHQIVGECRQHGWLKNQHDIQVGRTKVFIKATAQDILQQWLLTVHSMAICTVQSYARMLIAWRLRGRRWQMQGAALCIQHHWRKRCKWVRRCLEAAVLLQNTWRLWQVRKTEARCRSWFQQYAVSSLQLIVLTHHEMMSSLLVRQEEQSMWHLMMGQAALDRQQQLCNSEVKLRYWLLTQQALDWSYLTICLEETLCRHGLYAEEAQLREQWAAEAAEDYALQASGFPVLVEYGSRRRKLRLPVSSSMADVKSQALACWSTAELEAEYWDRDYKVWVELEGQGRAYPSVGHIRLVPKLQLPNHNCMAVLAGLPKGISATAIQTYLASMQLQCSNLQLIDEKTQGGAVLALVTLHDEASLQNFLQHQVLHLDGATVHVHRFLDVFDLNTLLTCCMDSRLKPNFSAMSSSQPTLSSFPKASIAQSSCPIKQPSPPSTDQQSQKSPQWPPAIKWDAPVLPSPATMPTYGSPKRVLKVQRNAPYQSARWKNPDPEVAMQMASQGQTTRRVILKPAPQSQSTYPYPNRYSWPNSAYQFES